MFRLGSTAKLLTWTAVMQLVEQGKLDLDTDINAYLDFSIPSELEYRRNGGEVAPITIRHLMSHTPGFEDYMTGTFSLSEEETLSLREYVQERRPARVFPPGEVTAYSNYGTVLAGYIVEVVSGVPYAQYIEDHIYGPLGMENSSFRQPLPAQLADHMSKAYRYIDGEFREGNFEFMQEPSGGMSSTAVDMARFMLAYLQDGESDGQRILMSETVQGMFSDPFTLHPRLDGTAHGFIKATYNGREVFHHPGGTMLYDTGLYLLRDEEVGFFISHSGGNYLVNIEIFQAFMDRYFPGGVGISPIPPEGMADRAGAFEGEYQQNRRSFTTVDKFLSLMMGIIHVRVDGGGFLAVTHLGETNRFVEVEPGVYHNLREGRTQDYGGDFRTIVFTTDPLGKIMLMTDGPMSYSRAAWYETTGITLLSMMIALGIIIVSLLSWIVKMLVHRGRRRNAQPEQLDRGGPWPRRLAVFQGLLAVVFLLQFLAEGAADPVYGLPISAFTQPSTMTRILDWVIPYGMAVTGLAVTVLAVQNWRKSHGNILGRIHYTLFTAAGLILIWIFYFYNVI